MPDLDLHGEAAVKAILEDALRGSPADQTELVLLAGRTDVTRYANSEIHQNVSQANTRVAVRVAVGRGKKIKFMDCRELNNLTVKFWPAEGFGALRLRSRNGFLHFPLEMHHTESRPCRNSFYATAS